MPLTIRRCGKQVHTSADNLEAYQLVDDDLGRLVQWTLGSQQELWEVRFVFTHVCGPNGGTVLGLGFGTADVRMEEVDILECENLAVCDAYDGEINILGQQVSKDGLDLCEPSSGTCEEESITAMYDSSQGLLRFTVDSRRCRGQFRADIMKESLRHRELYPTVAFANRKSKVRIELIRCLMAMPVPRDERLLRRDFSTSLTVATDEGASDFPSGCVIFEVDGRKLRADKFLLAARSVYFERMLHTGMSEGAASQVPIPRASAPAFEAVLRFIYSAGQAGQVLFEQADPLEVLHLSIEFLLEDLTRLCEWKLMQGLTLDNALATFGSVVSVRNQVPALVESCIERMQGRMKDVVGSESFKELCRSEVGVRELLLSLDEPLAKRRRLQVPGIRPG
ncbi:BTBD9 [Symbiodinium pilosum]|uniref:BTBD9 protein n=1 Tax=Symbiodinium pilosum TaxID=2952 RepID=A0A812T677_SYMPI|nr:BTBD9 [Symbiodinium pilosum]